MFGRTTQSFSRCRHSDFTSVAAYLLTMTLLAWAVLHGAETMGYNWQWYRVSRFLILPDGSPGPLLLGAGITLMVSGLGFLGAAALALATALVRLSGSLVGRALARAYLELIDPQHPTPGPNLLHLFRPWPIPWDRAFDCSRPRPDPV